jgi:hypothetical protein
LLSWRGGELEPLLLAADARAVGLGFSSGLEGLAARGGLGLGGGIFEDEAVLELVAAVAGLNEV